MLVEHLRANGDDVRALVRGSSSADVKARLVRAGATVVEGDVSDEASLRSAAEGCEVLVHAAASVTLRGTRETHEQVNLVGTENALSAAKSAGVRRFVQVSSESVTRGAVARNYVDEKFPSPAEFLDAYGQTKALAEDLVVAENRAGFETVALRPALVWGPDDTSALPQVLTAVADGRFVWIGGGESLFATTYILTLCDGISRAMRVPEAAGGVYYITDDERQTAREFFGQLFRAAGMSVPRTSVPFAVAWAAAWVAEKTMKAPVFTRGEIGLMGLSSHFNVQRARKDLGWAPSVTVTEGIERTRQWIARTGLDVVRKGRPSPDAVAT